MTPLQLSSWAERHHITPAALADLLAIMLPPCDPPEHKGRALTGEAGVQALLRLEAAAAGWHLWRNNVGVLQDKRGVPVRYGLANDSAQLNARIKSSDLIGWRPLVITPAHVGKTVAQFVCREVKAPGWRYTGDDREEAQRRWIGMVLAAGGDACFANGPGTIKK